MRPPNFTILTGGLVLLATLSASPARAQASLRTSEITFLPSGAPATPETPPAGDTVYLDWVSPLQAPRGLVMPDGPTTSAAHGSHPATSFAAGPPVTAVPEPGSLALLACGLLPAAAFLRRRRPA